MKDSMQGGVPSNLIDDNGDTVIHPFGQGVGPEQSSVNSSDQQDRCTDPAKIRPHPRRVTNASDMKRLIDQTGN